MYNSTLAIKIPPKEFSENSDIYTKEERQFNTYFSRRMIVGRSAYCEFYLLQPIGQVEPVERFKPMNRNTKQSSQHESFASLFQKATKKHATNKKHSSNGFDALC